MACFIGFMFAPSICNCSVTISGVASLAAISAGFGLVDVFFWMLILGVLGLARHIFTFQVQLSDGTLLVAMYSFSLYEPQYSVFKNVSPTAGEMQVTTPH